MPFPYKMHNYTQSWPREAYYPEGNLILLCLLRGMMKWEIWLDFALENTSLFLVKKVI